MKTSQPSATPDKTAIIKAHMAGQKVNGKPDLKKAKDYYNDAFPVDFDSVSVAELKLSGRPKNMLRHHRIETLGQLLSKPDEDLLKLRMMGKKAVSEVRAAVKEWADRNK